MRAVPPLAVDVHSCHHDHEQYCLEIIIKKNQKMIQLTTTLVDWQLSPAGVSNTAALPGMLQYLPRLVTAF